MTSRNSPTPKPLDCTPTINEVRDAPGGPTSPTVDDAECETLDSDVGRGRNDPLDESQIKRKCPRCDALVRSDARACPGCRLEFPWMEMAEYCAEGEYGE